MAHSPWRPARLLRWMALGFCVMFLTLTVVGAASGVGAQPADATDVLAIESTDASVVDRNR